MCIYIYIHIYIYISSVYPKSQGDFPLTSQSSHWVSSLDRPWSMETIHTIRQSLPGTTELPSPIHSKRWLWKSPAEYITVTSSAKHGGTISMLVIRSGVFRSWRVCWVLWCSWVRVLVELFFTLTVIKLPLILGWIQKAGWNCCPYLPIFSNRLRWLLPVPTERPFVQYGPLLGIHSRPEDATAPPVPIGSSRGQVGSKGGKI